MKSVINPHRPAYLVTLYTQTYTNMHVNITEASTSIWPLAISAIGRPIGYLKITP